MTVGQEKWYNLFTMIQLSEEIRQLEDKWVAIDEKGDSSLEILALLDSGADKSLFNAEIAKVLKIDLSTASEENFTGIEGGVLKAKVKTIHLQMVRDTEIFEVPVGFIENVGFSAILGQEGFFDKFSITFNREKLEIEIKKV